MISKKQLLKLRSEERKNRNHAEDFSLVIYFRGRQEMIEDILKVHYEWQE